jgi:Kef-type K+ transport system membrane component KefB
MNVAPFHPDPRMVTLFEFVGITAAALTAGLVLRKALDRFLPDDDPRRMFIAQVLLYGGTFIVIAVSMWLRHRG